MTPSIGLGYRMAPFVSKQRFYGQRIRVSSLGRGLFKRINRINVACTIRVTVDIIQCGCCAHYRTRPALGSDSACRIKNSGRDPAREVPVKKALNDSRIGSRIGSDLSLPQLRTRLLEPLFRCMARQNIPSLFIFVSSSRNAGLSSLKKKKRMLPTRIPRSF